MHERRSRHAITLTTERLVLRDFGSEDWRDVHEYASRLDVCRYQSWGPNTPEQTREYVEAAAAAAEEEPRSWYQLAIVHASEDRVIGATGLHVQSRRFRSAELSYGLNPRYWGKGFATEAEQAIVSFGFTALHLHRIEATCDPRNTASERVMQRLGMRHEGRKREVVLIRDGWRDSQLYSVLQHEWQSPLLGLQVSPSPHQP